MAQSHISNWSLASMIALALWSGPMLTPAQARQPGCPSAERREALSAIQTHVLQSAPETVESFETAVQSGGPLAGWRLAHGYVVIEGAGAIAVHNLARKFPDPQVLFYAPPPGSKPSAWLDFDGPDNPYKLVGWAFLAPYQDDGSKAPLLMPCVTGVEWVVHEAGWHLRDGGMHLTPGAETEPPRPLDQTAIHFWHPRHWDLHFWRGANGAPTVSFHNPDAREGGMRLPRGSFFYIINGRPWPEPAAQRAAVPIRWQE